MAQAREDYRTQQYLCCLDRCEVLTTGYADLGDGSEAHQLAEEIKNNPEWLQRACESANDRLGNLYLALAETWIAQVRLASLQGRRLCRRSSKSRTERD